MEPLTEHDYRLPEILHYFQHGTWHNGRVMYSDELCEEIVEKALQDVVRNVDEALGCLYPLGRHQEAYEYIHKWLMDPTLDWIDRLIFLNATRYFAHVHPQFYFIAVCYCFSPVAEERSLANEIVSEVYDSIRQKYPGVDFLGKFFLSKAYPFDWVYLQRIESAYEDKKRKKRK